MGRGIVAFLALLAFVPAALHVISMHERELAETRQARQAMLEQQAIEIAGQDFEESFWRVVEYAAPDEAAVHSGLGNWSDRMRADNITAWHGDTGGSAYAELLYAKAGKFDPKKAVIVMRPANGGFVSVSGSGHDGHDAIIARIARGSSRGIYLIPEGSSHEYT
jgi:hypothetical protein